QKNAPSLTPYAMWIDTLAFESMYDYDPVWEKCMDLGVAVATHVSAQGWDAHRTQSFVYNHCASFAQAHEAFAKSLVLGGVTRRFPELNFAFLEGGSIWASELYSGLISRCEKRGADGIGKIDHRAVDKNLMTSLIKEFGWDELKSRTNLEQGDFGAPNVSS